MKAEDYIKKYGEAAYEKTLQEDKERHAQHSEDNNAKRREWDKDHPGEVKARARESSNKGGKYYAQQLEYKRTGLQGERRVIRRKHASQYRVLKQIIAPDSQIHHEWIPGTADFRGVALVETNPHQYGFIDVIQILEGEITLLTEEAIMTGVINQ